MKDLLDTYPSEKRAISLKKEMDLSLLETLNYLIKVISNKIPELRKYEKYILNLNQDVNFNKISLNSSFYILNKRLQDEIKQGNIIEINNILVNLINVIPNIKNYIVFSELRKENKNFIHDCFVTIFTEEFKNASNINFEYENCTNYNYSVESSQKALNCLSVVDKELFNEISVYLSNILILNTSQINAGSSFFTFGLLYLKELDVSQHWIILLEHIVHESAHLHLYAIWKKDPIVLNNKEEKFKSPLRKDPRPMSGIFHAMFVLSRLVYLEDKILDSKEFKSVVSHWTKFNNNARNNASFKEKFYDTYNTISKFGKLTNLGDELLNNCKIMVDKITVPKTVYK